MYPRTLRLLHRTGGGSLRSREERRTLLSGLVLLGRITPVLFVLRRFLGAEVNVDAHRYLPVSFVGAWEQLNGDEYILLVGTRKGPRAPAVPYGFWFEVDCCFCLFVFRPHSLHVRLRENSRALTPAPHVYEVGRARAVPRMAS